jgi:general secretion pathway protein K
MVLACISVLSILVTEFTYIAQISQAIAFGGLDHAQAHYLAKSGLKLSLLRLKLFQQVQPLLKRLPPGTGNMQGMINKVGWSAPFMYPIPTQLLGLSPGDRDLVKKFEHEIGIEGKFSITITSESSKYNLNSFLPRLNGEPPPPPQTSTGAGQNGAPPPPPPPPFDAAQSRNSLAEHLKGLMKLRMETDSAFAATYRDLRITDLVDEIAGWADRTYTRQTATSRDPVPMKQAPFYSITELHNLATLDDDLYQLFASQMTAHETTGINVNTLQGATLRAIIPLMTADEVKAFFVFRDSETQDNLFKQVDDFYQYLAQNVAAYRNKPQSLDDLKNKLTERNIRLITDETLFKIMVQASVNAASRTIEAWVSLETAKAPQDLGIKLTYLRIY